MFDSIRRWFRRDAPDIDEEATRDALEENESAGLGETWNGEPAEEQSAAEGAPRPRSKIRPEIGPIGNGLPS